VSFKALETPSTSFKRSLASYRMEKSINVTRAPKHLIAALRNTLHKLEMAVPPDADQLIFAELKRNLNQHIAKLENCATTISVVLPDAKPKQAMDS
jgi:hypothetical protein